MNALRSARPRLTGAYASPARAELALAIGELAAHDAKVARLSSALPALEERRYSAWTARDDAEAALTTAAAAHAAHVLAETSGDAVEGAEAPPSPQEAARRLKHAKDGVETAGGAYELCEQQIREAADDRPRLDSKVKMAAAAVLRDTSAVGSLVHRMDRATEELISLASEFVFLARENVLECRDEHGMQVQTPEAQAMTRRLTRIQDVRWDQIFPCAVMPRPMAGKWEVALAGLQLDANARVPEGAP